MQVVTSIFLGYMIQKLEKIELIIDKMEKEILMLKLSVPKRRGDYGENK